MFTRQRLLDTYRNLAALGPTISREARRAHIATSAWTNCAEMAVRRSGVNLVVAGAYDRSAIMQAALLQARARQRVNGAPWAACLADALRGVWKFARAQRAQPRSTEAAPMASHDPITTALDALFASAADLRIAAADMRPVTPAEFQQQLALLALAARIRTDVARIGNERHEAAQSVPAKNAYATTLTVRAA